MEFTTEQLAGCADWQEVEERIAQDECSAVIVDWREADTDIVEYVASAIGSSDLKGNLSPEGALTISYRSRSAVAPLTMSPRDRMITVDTINRVVQGDWEIRVIAESLQSDTYELYVKPPSWWAEAEVRYRDQVGRYFRTVPSVIADEARPKAAPAAPAARVMPAPSPLLVFGGLFVLLALLFLCGAVDYITHDPTMLYIGFPCVALVIYGWKRDRLQSVKYRGIPLYTVLGGKRKKL